MVRKRSRIGGILLAGLVAGCGAAGDPPPPVLSLVEIRGERVVLQEWDLSCGAASLATVLNFQHGDPATEREIALSLMGREEYLADPMLVLARDGFSLLDLHRYVTARGYRGEGLGRLEFADLVERAPIIVPIEEDGYDHYVVFRGRLGDRVLLADPAYGTRTMTVEQFEAAWPSLDELGRVGFVVSRADGLSPPNRLAPRPAEFLTFN